MERGPALILLVEDEPDHSELIARGLEGTAVALEIVESLASARAWLATRTPDLVIADVRLPDGGAFDLLAPDACLAPIVVMTSHGGEQQVVEAMKRGALDYVIKSPAMFRELPLIVDRALRSARQLVEKRRIRAQLHDSELKFNQLARAIQEVFWLYEPATDEVVYVSPAWETLFGTPPSTVLGPLARRLAVIDSPDRERIAKQLQTDATTAPLRFEYRAHGPVGELVILERTYPLPDDRGRPWRVAGVMSDVTQRRTLEDVVWRAQRLGALGKLVGGVAHELNNMLATIMVATDELAERVRDDREARRLADMIGQAAGRNYELTQQLVAFARVGNHTTTPIDLNRLVWDTISLLRRSLEQRVMIVGDLRASPASVCGDQVQLQSALLELGLQARDRGGALAFETDNVVLDETACASLPFEVTPGPFVQVAVFASGITDVAELRERIFDPLSGADPSANLGLGAVCGIAVAHRGAIAVYGNPDTGCVVKLYIPLARDARTSPAPVAQETPHGSGHVLVIDDEPLVGEALRRVLVGLGYSITLARDGHDALEKLRAEPFAAIICDLMMPKLHGIELLREIRALAPATPLIASSGYVRDQDVAALDTVGIAAYLPKPVRRADLAAVLAASIIRN